MTNYGLFIIWPNYFSLADNILDDLKNKFEIIETYDFEWSKDTLKDNIYRFYGDRLATSSILEKAKDEYKFKLVIIEDKSPSFEFRLNARGVEKVNINFFDTKKYLRKKYNTKFGIHGSNDENETNRDLCLLLGINLEDYKLKDKSDKTISLKRNITGHNGWKNVNELFYFLNAVDEYVVLRNEHEITNNMSRDDDIDFLVYDRKKIAYFLNAKKMSKGSERVNYEIILNDKPVRVDLRYIGDGYFDEFWQKKCLKTRVLNEDNIYVLNEENSYFSLIYHTLIHKRKIPQKYLDYFKLNVPQLQEKLYKYMYENDYRMVEPKDVTLNFNKKYGGDIKFSRDRRIRYKKGVKGIIKRLLYKLNNLIHFRRGPA